ncbi:MAG: response regulator transcription factor [Ruminococcus sp.]|nr:response regulator transcription factor [Ruminococcus sp.]
MLKIALCEDNPVSRKLMKNMLDKIHTMRNLCVTDISSGFDCMDRIAKVSPDIILLDERFCSGSSDISNLIKNTGCNSEIIYLTSYPEYMTAGKSESSPLSCILKPIRYEDMEKTILSIINETASAGDTMFRCGHSNVTMRLDDIIYLEADKRITNIRTIEKSFVSTENISSISERLPGLFFFRTHRTYTLNFRHIANIDREVIQMRNGECVILSRQRKKDFESAYNVFREKIAT